MKNRKESDSPAQTSFIDEIIVDNFAGGGGASTRIELAAGRDNVAYEQYNAKGGAAWRCKCFDCGYIVDKGNKVRHDAQLNWNGEGKA